ncbi:hypothetical protein BZA05DRAFT_387822 [Tricharina praecox]|uniref:uncharacterized protein n=1 Tax=Tricharina praecox TaxID=43433 RepID=UPI00221F616F|nr:uncharacterized protein BZA05DRAFT_387822 [Tricharina praecox]KAI5856235.1 hypothetical protein BZA05DRAFT_387822 [Tricharina praecox]
MVLVALLYGKDRRHLTRLRTLGLDTYSLTDVSIAFNRTHVTKYIVKICPVHRLHHRRHFSFLYGLHPINFVNFIRESAKFLELYGFIGNANKRPQAVMDAESQWRPRRLEAYMPHDCVAILIYRYPTRSRQLSGYLPNRVSPYDTGYSTQPESVSTGANSARVHMYLRDSLPGTPSKS